MVDKASKLFKEMYYFENEKKNKINTNLGIPIAILTLLFGVITYYLQNLTCLGCDVRAVLFYIFFGATLLSVIFTICFLIRAFYNYEYAYLPTPSDITAKIEDIKNYYKHPYFKNNKKEELERLIEDNINSVITGYYKKCLEVNIANNDKKSKCLHSSSSGLIAIIIFLFLSSIPFYIKYYSNPKIQKIEIINPREEVIQMQDEEKKNDQKPESPPPKAEESEIRFIKEGEEKPREKSEND